MILGITGGTGDPDRTEPDGTPGIGIIARIRTGSGRRAGRFQPDGTAGLGIGDITSRQRIFNLSHLSVLSKKVNLCTDECNPQTE